MTMQTIEILDSILDEEVENISPIVKIEEYKEVDPRFKRLSYSSDLLFNGCERKFQILKMNPRPDKQDELDWKRRLTFSFGTVVGEAVQHILEGWAKDKVIFHAFKSWNEHLFSENDKQKKTFFHALNAIVKFISMREDGFLDEYELVYYDGKPASELSFKVNFPEGFTERGFVDIVLRNKITDKFAIFEIKTDSGRYMRPEKYKNSSQATGYSVILDRIEPGQTEYTVYYLVYMTWLEQWECFEFAKTATMRAAWVDDKLETNDRIKSLVAKRGNYGIWPMRGNHCMSFNSACQFLGTCHMSTDSLVVPLRESDFEESYEYTFVFNLEEILV